MTPNEATNVAAVRAYFDGCNTGVVDDLLRTLAPDVVHYFLAPTFPPIRGAEHLARFWRKYKQTLDPMWAIDRIVAQDDEVVSEWSCAWSAPGSRDRYMTRGTEWYVMREGRIAEVRAYFVADPRASSELQAFPYGERGYLSAQGAAQDR